MWSNTRPASHMRAHYEHIANVRAVSEALDLYGPFLGNLAVRVVHQCMHCMAYASHLKKLL